MLVVSADKNDAGIPTALAISVAKYWRASFNCNFCGSNPKAVNSTSAFRNAVALVLRATFQESKSFVIRSGVRFVPFDFNTIVGTGSFA